MVRAQLDTTATVRPTVMSSTATTVSLKRDWQRRGVQGKGQMRTWEAGGNTTKRGRHSRQPRRGVGVNRALALPPEEAAELALAGRLLGIPAVARRRRLGGCAEGRQARIHADGRRRGACRCRHVRCGEVRGRCGRRRTGGRKRCIHLHKPRMMWNPVFAFVSTGRVNGEQTHSKTHLVRLGHMHDGRKGHRCMMTRPVENGEWAIWKGRSGAWAETHLS